jgi:putative endonuclease
MTTGRMRHEAGFAAEEIAERAYVARGAQVVARRWACRAGEIDLVLREGPVIVFAEVRARRRPGAAAASITPAKLRRMVAAVEAWLAAEGLSPDTDIRLDAVLVAGDGSAEIIGNIGV